ncbi:MAG: phenylalanine--tRNA ligase beta subunit-related protein [Myxococcota bacterium]
MSSDIPSPPPSIIWSLDHPDLCVGVVEADGVTIADADDALTAHIAAELEQLPAEWPSKGLKAAIRDLLRRGGYRPSGRNKPASEYLIQVASRGRFPAINNVVDINNLMSLRTAWPMSVLDRARTLGDAEALEVRFGREGEQYVFNSVGQTIDLKGLIGLGRRGGPLMGNPVKDAMAAKTDATTQTLIAVLWTSTAVASVQQVEAVAQTYAQLLQTHTGARTTRVEVVRPPVE